MDVNPCLDLVLDHSRFGACDDTPTLLDDGMHQRREFENSVIWESLWTLVVEIDEKLEHVSLLLDHVNLLTESYCVYTFYVKFVKLFVWNLKNSTIHKDVGPRALVCQPFLHGYLELFVFIGLVGRMNEYQTSHLVFQVL